MATDIFTKSITGSLFFEYAATLNGMRIWSSDNFVNNVKRRTSRRQSRRMADMTGTES
jgi:hypothetical protein